MRLFSSLPAEKTWDEWAEILDWILNDERFLKESGWDRRNLTKFIKRVKQLDGFSKENFQCDKLENLHFPKKQPSELPLVLMSKNDAESRELVRRIRNGIAHGKNKIFSNKGKTYIEITDYHNEKQTAYIAIPLEFIPKIYKIYAEIEKAAQNDRSQKSDKRGKKQKR